MILRKTITRNIREKKFQYIGVTLLLFLSVMLFISLSLAISTLEERNKKFSQDHNQESFHFLTGETVTDRQIESWENEFSLMLEKRHYQDINLDEETTLRLFDQTEKVNIPYISQGHMPNEIGEIAIAQEFANKNGYEVGDSIKLNGMEGNITGFVYLPDYIYMVQQQSDLLSNAAQFGIGVTSKQTLKKFAGTLQSEVLGLTGSDGTSKDFRSAVSDEVTLLEYVGKEDNTRIQFVETEIEGARATITTLPLFVLALSIAMVIMLMKRRMDMQRKEIGTLMALGYSKKELQRHYLGYAWVVGLTGTILGIIAGAGLSIPVSNMYATYFNLPAISLFNWDPFVIVMGLVVPLLLLLLMTGLMIQLTLKKDPLTLLRPQEMAIGKKSWLEKLPWFNKGSFVRRFKLRLMVRSKARSLYIFIGVMFSTVLLLFGFITFHSMDQLVESTFENIQTYDYAVHYETVQTKTPMNSASPFIMTEVTVAEKEKQEKANLYGINPNTDYLNLLRGKESLNNELLKGTVISKPLAEILEVGVGDPLTVINTRNNKVLTTKIAGVTDLYIGSSLYLPKTKVSDFLELPEGAYTSVWQSKPPGNDDQIFMIENKQQAIDSFEATSGATRYSVIGMAVFAVLIGVIVLTLLTNLIVEENSPSISLFKVMGYQDQEVSNLVLSVYTPVVILSYFLSIPIAIFSLKQIMSTLVSETGFLFPTDITWWMVLLGFVIIIVTYWFSLTLSKQKLKKVSLQEALKKQQD